MARYKKASRRTSVFKSSSLPSVGGRKLASESSTAKKSAAYRGSESCRIAKVMARLGAEHHDIATALGISISSFHEWGRTQPEFAEALKIGNDASRASIGRDLLRRALGYSRPIEKSFRRRGEIIRAKKIEHVTPEVKAAHIWLRVRKPDVYGDLKRKEHKRDVALLKAFTEHNNRAARNEEAEYLDYRRNKSCRIAKSVALLGAADCEIAEALGISVSMLNEWRHKYVEFSEAVKEGKETVDAAVEAALLGCALGLNYPIEEIFCTRGGVVMRVQITKHIPADVDALQIWLCTHMPDVYSE